MFKNPVIDRTFFGAAILSGWFLFALFVWAFCFHDQPSNWFTVLAGFSGLGMGLTALFLTVIGWRYVLTGNEFPND